MDIDKIIESNGNIYRTHFPDIDVSITYRILSIKEYKVFRSLRDGGVLSPSLLAEQVFERCYFGNARILSEELPAGLSITVGSLIMYLSGDCDQLTLLQDINDARMLHPSDTVFEYMRSAIITAFPTYQLNDLENMSRSEYLRLFAISENIITKQNPEYERLDLSKVEDSSNRENKDKGPDIDFRKENREIRSAVGTWKQEEAEKQYREEQKISRNELRNLDSRGR